MYALIDCNNFFASCERVFRPDLIGKPIAVLSNNDGCVIARSNEVKALGIPMGAPAFKYREIFEKHQVHVFSTNFALYGDMSQRVMTILESFCSDIEVYSIDEAFLYFDNFNHYDAQAFLEEVYQKVLRSTGIPISIGLAETKTLAKVANRIAKKFVEKTGGVYIIDNEEKRIKALKWLQVGDIWGIGRRLSRRLNAEGVTTAYQFTQLDELYVKKKLSVVEARLHRELNGESVLRLDKKKMKQSIATTRTFERNQTEFKYLRERVVTFASICGEKLRKEGGCCRSLMIFIHTNGHRKELAQYSKNIVIKLPFATNSSIELAKFAEEGLRKIFLQGYQYKKAGVIAMDIIPEDAVQQNIFSNTNPKHHKAFEAIDTIHSVMGSHKIRLASQSRGRIWKMNQEQLSPNYSTRLSDIITVNL